MKIVFYEDQATVSSAVDRANSLLTNPNFFDAIANHGPFDLSTADSNTIAKLLKNSDLEFKVKIFNPNIFQSLKYRKTFAYTDGRFPNTLFLNGKKLDREIEDLAATIIHESVHALDDSIENYEFGHGDNSPAGKENTAPYWVGNLAYKMLKGDPHAKLLTFNEIEENITVV